MFMQNMSVPECLFRKHNVSSGKIVVDTLQYFEKLRQVQIRFEVTADGDSHGFSTVVPFNPSQGALLDSAFKEAEKALDAWLSDGRAFGALKLGLEGKTVFEWAA